jgi:hypothetical protein
MKLLDDGENDNSGGTAAAAAAAAKPLSMLKPDVSMHRELPRRSTSLQAQTRPSKSPFPSTTNGTAGHKRTRRLLPLSIFLGPLSVQQQCSSTGRTRKNWWNQFEEPDEAQVTQLLAVLLLTTGLGTLSALDAKIQCLKHETTAALELSNNDDLSDEDAYEAAVDQAKEIEATGCMKMFRGVCLPVLAATVGFGLMGFWLLRCLHRTRRSSAVRLTFSLVVVFLLILGAQTFLVTMIMLHPRNQDNTENPFHSLGAVDVTGQIGDNANLYYLVWMSEILSLALVYNSVAAFFRARRAADQAASAQGLLPATSWWIMDEDYDRERHESRHTWYKSLYMLRVRTGMWTAALITCLVLVASAQYVWRQFMWPYVLLDEGYIGTGGDGIFEPKDFSLCQTMSINSLGVISVTLCRRTVLAWFSGVISFLLSAFSIGMHLVARARAHGLVANEHRQQLYYMQRINIFRRLLNRHRVPLGIELVLATMLSILLGLNAVLSTSVEGPATQVGNLYYASWGAFLLVGRVAVGCLEEWFQVEPQDDKSVGSNNSGNTAKKLTQADPRKDTASNESAHNREEVDPEQDKGTYAQQSFETENSDISGTSSVMIDALEKDRVKRLRNYFFLCIFSACCGSAAIDAGVNQKDLNLSTPHRYMIVSPFIVALLSLILFLLCLSKRWYRSVSHMCVGGVLSVISFALWMGTLVLTMHSDHSWAVNSIGEIRMANLYYFCWASILTAGKLSTSSSSR